MELKWSQNMARGGTTVCVKRNAPICIMDHMNFWPPSPEKNRNWVCVSFDRDCNIVQNRPKCNQFTFLPFLEMVLPQRAERFFLNFLNMIIAVYPQNGTLLKTGLGLGLFGSSFLDIYFASEHLLCAGVLALKNVSVIQQHFASSHTWDQADV